MQKYYQRSHPARRLRRELGTAAALFAVAASFFVAVCPPAAAQTTAQEQAIVQKIDFEQKLNDQVPLDVRLVDENGQTVQLNQYFGKKPVILTLVYYECPMLCTEILNGLLQTMKEMQFTAGKEFDVITVSIDPRETPAMAAEKRDQYVRRYGKEGAAEGWHFFTGSETEVRRLADSVGYKYVYDPNTDQYAHPSGIVLLTPTGKISRYFYGVQYDQRDVRLGLVEASANKIGSPVDKVLLYCYHYDPLSGKYNVVVMNIVRAFGILTVVVMALGIFFLMRRSSTDKAQAEKPGLSVQG